MSAATGNAFVQAASGVYRLEAPLTFASVAPLRAPGLALIRASKSLTLDLHAVPVVDSAGLALLIDWLAEAKATGCQLKYDQLPQTLIALARLSDVEKLLAA